MKHALCCLILAGATSAVRAEVPSVPPAADLARATVTIPYSELRALWEAGQRKPEPPPAPAPAPLPFLIHRADLRLQFSEAGGVIDADFDVEALQGAWQTIPLLGGEARLDQAGAGGRPVVWAPCTDKAGGAAGTYALLTNTPGKTPVALRFATRGARQIGGAAPLRLRTGAAAVKRLTVTGVPAGMEARVNGRGADSLKNGAALFLLPAEPGELELELAAPKVEELPKPPPPVTPSQWQSQSQVLVRASEGRLHFEARVFARAEDGSGLSMRLALPASAGAVSLSGEDVEGWNQVRTAEGQRVLEVRWKTRDLLDRELKVAYAVPLSPLAEQWTLQAPAVLGEKEPRSLYAILPGEGLELKGQALRAAVESRRLPDWMRAEIGGMAFVTAESGPQLSLETHWLPTIATAEAIVTEAKAQLRLVEDGATQTSLSYEIKHAAPLAWALELPEGVELLSCAVGGVSTQPIQRAKGGIELALPAPSGGAKASTTVTLVYTAKTKALDPVSGQIALELPRTPLFIEHLEWAIGLPALYEITAFDGNVSGARQAGAPAAGEDRTIAFRKDFCRAERPGVALFYQRRGFEK